MYTVSNPDINTSKKGIQDFLREEFPDTHQFYESLAVSAVFATFQGEMPYTGYPAIFVRLAGCNRGLKKDCLWCDTEFSLDKAKIYQPYDLADLVVSKFSEVTTLDPPLIVISGGEPFLQLKAIMCFLDELHVKVINAGYGNIMPMVQFETNGDYLDEFKKLYQYKPRVESQFIETGQMTVVVSPKAHPIVGFNPTTGPAFRELDKTKVKTFIRCVVSADPSDPYHQIPRWVYELPRHQVYLSPICVYDGIVDHGVVIDFWTGSGIQRELTGANYQYAQQLAAKHGFRLSTQSHLLFNIE